MSADLITLKNKLIYLREYLVKLGPQKRYTELAISKYSEAQIEYKNLESIVSRINCNLEKSKISSSEVELIQNSIDEIHSVYKKIKDLFIIESCSLTSDLTIMASNFDIKTAISLLPVMTGQEQITSQLIDSIEMYSGMLNAPGQEQLIEFVLKTRLNASAKLRLKPTYPSVEILISDIRKYLLPKKSAVAILSQLHSTTQGHRSIENYGNDLEQLFVNLTLAQADGDDKKFAILRPINEKVAIKRFADGLNNFRLSTVIAARQFDSLPEAIRTAMDEHSLLPNDNNQVMKLREQERPRSFNNFRGNYQKNNYNRSNNHGSFPTHSRSYYNSRSSRGRGRGGEYARRPAATPASSHSRSYQNRTRAPRPQINSVEQTREHTQEDSEFFRASPK